MKAIRSQDAITLSVYGVALLLFFCGVATIATLIILAILGRITWPDLIIGVVTGLAASVGWDLILGRLIRSRRQSTKRDTDNHASE
jgi:hypothetical protein